MDAVTRPRQDDDRVSTSVKFPRDVYDELKAAADERVVSVNWLINKAIAEFLPRLLPVDEIKWTRDP